jgi:peptide chain release factor 1
MPEFKDNTVQCVIDALEKKARDYDELGEKLADPEFVSQLRDSRYAEVAREHGELRKIVETYEKLKEALKQEKDAEEILGDSGDDPEMREFAEQELEKARQTKQKLIDAAIATLCTDSEDNKRNVIMEIRGGTGGEEAALFAADLFRMYNHYAQKQGWKVKAVDQNVTDMGGFRYLILSISGKDVWERLKYESGGHRVQRVPETESQGRIHTSLATVAVLPEAEEVDIEIDPNDLEIGFMRSQGPGGQSVNKLNSCVRIVHKPTGISVKCQEEKSQHKNRKLALKLLRTKLYERKQKERKKKRDSLRRTQIGSGDRNERIRTYNFPQDRVTDHRIGKDIFGIENVLMGNIDELLEALMNWGQQQKIEELKQQFEDEN